jgi:hypothetical protein
MHHIMHCEIRVNLVFDASPSLTTTKVAVRPGIGLKSAVRPGGGVVRQAGNFYPNTRSCGPTDGQTEICGPTGGRSLEKGRVSLFVLCCQQEPWSEGELSRDAGKAKDSEGPEVNLPAVGGSHLPNNCDNGFLNFIK